PSAAAGADPDGVRLLRSLPHAARRPLVEKSPRTDDGHVLPAVAGAIRPDQPRFSPASPPGREFRGLCGQITPQDSPPCWRCTPRVRAIPAGRLMVAGSDLRASDSVSAPARGAAAGPNRRNKVSLFCGVGCYSPWSSSVLPAHAGMIRDAVHQRDEHPRAPRACGDDPEYYELIGPTLSTTTTVLPAVAGVIP